MSWNKKKKKGYWCGYCNERFLTKSDLYDHAQQIHPHLQDSRQVKRARKKSQLPE